MVKLGEHFASDDRSRHSEWLRQQKWFIKARQDNQRRDTVESRAGCFCFCSGGCDGKPNQD